MKRIGKKLICLVLTTALLTVVFPACSNGKRQTATYFDLFDTVITLTAYADDETFTEMSGMAEESFKRYDALFDIYSRTDGVTSLADVNSRAGEAVKVDEAIIELLSFGREVYCRTEGAVNIAMGAVLSLWHEARLVGTEEPEKALLPDRDALEEASKHCDIEKLVIDRDKGEITLTDPEMRIDVGAIAKGWAADRVAESLRAFGASFLLNCGGAILTYGDKPGGEPWKVGIDDPLGDGVVKTVDIRDSAMSSSGSYLRSFTVDGREYGHIIDPETLMPADPILSVTVVLTGENCAARADALSTACFILGEEKGAELVESIPGAYALFVSKDGTVSASRSVP